ncbi:MAG: VWA domain-containing protein [Bacteroidales bacterium]|nr:VWA domain-containing protein [Bacteroidales bacterium]MCB8999263.1 VWA domain-containing protein [Bacteroidales bacterium]MCB9013069.1 VWA domain-containing protein [Bacteroidales bacterium]
MPYFTIDRLRNFIILLFVAGMIMPKSIYAQEASGKTKALTRILFIFDASQSMSGTWESDNKINIARNILIDLVDSLQNVENVEMALRVYGHQSPVPPQDCSDTRLEVPFAQGNASRIRQKLKFITPKGTTPIAYSLALAPGDFPECDNCRNIILLITDGIEACDGDPCAVSLELQKKGIILKPFIIGIGLDPGFHETFDCLGYYFNAQNEDKFREVLGTVITQVLNTTTTQVNLLDMNGLPTETDVNMTFYDSFSGKIKYNLVHTLNHKGNPDTLYLDHLVTYRLKVHTIPPIIKDSIQIIPGKHTIIAVNAPQGYLQVKTPKGKSYDGLLITLRKSGETQTLVNQEIGKIGKYLVGKYDLEIPIIPRLIIKNVEILQSHTTSIEVPEPGVISFIGSSNGYGSLYIMRSNEQEWVYNLNPALRQQTVLLQPGLYRLVFRSAAVKTSSLTVVKNFEVKPGEIFNIETN